MGAGVGCSIPGKPTPAAFATAVATAATPPMEGIFQFPSLEVTPASYLTDGKSTKRRPPKLLLLVTEIGRRSHPVKYRYAITMRLKTAPELTTSQWFQLKRDSRRCSSVTVA